MKYKLFKDIQYILTPLHPPSPPARHAAAISKAAAGPLPYGDWENASDMEPKNYSKWWL